MFLACHTLKQLSFHKARKPDFIQGCQTGFGIKGRCLSHFLFRERQRRVWTDEKWPSNLERVSTDQMFSQNLISGFIYLFLLIVSNLDLIHSLGTDTLVIQLVCKPDVQNDMQRIWLVSSENQTYVAEHMRDINHNDWVCSFCEQKVSAVNRPASIRLSSKPYIWDIGECVWLGSPTYLHN